MNVKAIADKYLQAKDVPSDINEHLEILHALSLECSHIVEAGVRYVVSTWAFLLGCACRGGEVHSYCWNLIPEIQSALDLCKKSKVPWSYYDGDWLKRDIPETDLLFIDTNHFYSQLSQELNTHGNKARKFLALHDTVSFGTVGADNKTPGLWAAVEEFLDTNHCWHIKSHYTNCNGLTVLERTNEDS